MTVVERGPRVKMRQLSTKFLLAKKTKDIDDVDDDDDDNNDDDVDDADDDADEIL